MRLWEENEGCGPERLHKNQHWYWTHKLAYDILAPVAKERGIALAFRHVHRHFGHTNSAKCKDAARNRGQGPALMFDNCRPFIARDVELLQPDVLVTQGRFGRLSVDGRFKIVARLAHPQDSRYVCNIIQMGKRQVLMFSVAHQNAYGLFNAERRGAYPWYIRTAHEFLLRGQVTSREA